MGWIEPITDRTLSDVSNKTSKGYLNVTDLNRIEQNCIYLADMLNSYGYSVTIQTDTKKALQFDGRYDYIDCGDVLDMGLNDYTIEARVKTSNSVEYQYIVSKSWRASGNYRYGTYITLNGCVGIFMRGSSGPDVLCEGNIFVADGKMHHLAFVFDRDGNASLYVDGIFDKAQSIAHWVNANMQSNHPFRIGSYTEADNVSPSFFFDGTIDEFRVWNVVRTQEQIQENMNRWLYGIEPGLIGYWKLDEGSGATVYDSAGANHGTINGATWFDTGTKYKNWRMTDFPFQTQIDRIRDNINALIDAYHKKTGSPDIRYVDTLNYNDANSLEQNLLNIDILLQRMITSFWYSGEIHGGER